METVLTNNTEHLQWVDGQLLMPGDNRVVDLPQPEPVAEASPTSDSVAGEDSPKPRRK